MWLDGVSYTVIGVMPARLRLLDARLWVPMAWDAATKEVRGGHDPLVMGRLAPGATPESAEREMTVLAERLARRYPETNAGWSVLVSPLFEEVVGSVRRSLWILLGAACFVLLIACANVREPASRARSGARQGASDPRCSRREPSAARPTALDRESAPLPARRSGGPTRGFLGDRSAG